MMVLFRVKEKLPVIGADNVVQVARAIPVETWVSVDQIAANVSYQGNGTPDMISIVGATLELERRGYLEREEITAV